VYANGYALIGELGKAARVSVQRFPAVVPDAPGHTAPSLVLVVTGMPGPSPAAPGGRELVTVTVLAPGGVMRAVPLSFTGLVPLNATVVCTGAGAAAACSVA